jgi:hypothetical protein
MPVGRSIRLSKAIEIGKQRAERHQVFEASTCRGDAATRSEHFVQLPATSLIDRQRLALDSIARRAHTSGTREMFSSIVKAMDCRCDLGLNQWRAK